MIGKEILTISIPGRVSTNGSSEIDGWRETLQSSFCLLPCLRLGNKKIAVHMGIWLNPKRLYGRQNDLDNLTKPIFDAMQRVETIADDSYVSSLQVSKHPTDGEECLEIIVYEWDD